MLQNSLPAIPAYVLRAIPPEQFLDQHSCLDLSWNPLRRRLPLLEEAHLEIRICLFTLDYLIKEDSSTSPDKNANPEIALEVLRAILPGQFLD